METELKILLDDRAERSLRRNPALRALSDGGVRRRQLRAIYFDTEDQALKRAGLALRIRREGRDWVQCIKRATTEAGAGLARRAEEERRVPGPRPMLDAGSELMAAVREALAGRALQPVFETRVTRQLRLLRATDGTAVEYALDRGAITTPGGAVAPILEAELELKAGPLSGLYRTASALFTEGPVRLASDSKAERGYRLAAGGDGAPAEPAAAWPALDRDMTTEEAASVALRACIARIAFEQARSVASDAPEGPHQLRVWLRRLRTVLKGLAAQMDADSAAALEDRVADLARAVSPLRDLDVLAGELAGPVLARVAWRGVSGEALLPALDAERARARAAVRALLRGPTAQGLILDLAAYVETRGWLRPEELGQTARLARPIGGLAPALLETRYRKVLKAAGRDVAALDTEGLHDLRKKLKTLRYSVEMTASLFSGRKLKAFMKRLKGLQDRFGDLTDAAMAEAVLGAEDAPWRGPPEAERALGYVLGVVATRAEASRPGILQAFGEFAEAKPYWR